MAQLQIVQQINRAMECSSCGAAGIAACDCGAPYMPAADRAAKAIAANPDKSTREIADEIGVGKSTVSRIRQATVPDGTVTTRTGKDGVTRVLPKRKPKPEEISMPRPWAKKPKPGEVIPTEEEAEESYQQQLYEIMVDYLADMTEQTRRKYFAHIRRKYRDEL